VQINLFATLRQVVGGKTVELETPEGLTVQELLDALLARFPALRSQLYDSEGTLYPHIHIFVNGRDAQYLAQGLDTALQPDDTVNLFPPVGGG
jgi:sulfur-carrier protein